MMLLLHSNNNTIQFVDREQEMRYIERSISQLFRDQLIPKQIFEFNGIGGIGKTFILNNIARRCCSKNLTLLKYDFNVRINNKARNLRNFVSQMIDQIKIITDSKNKLLNILSEPETTFTDIEKLFIIYILEIINVNNMPLVLIFDSLDEINEIIKECLCCLISETIDTGRIMFFLASKCSLDLPLDVNIQNRWQTYRLTQFSTKETKDQLETFENTLSSEEVEELSRYIFNITKGHPLSNNLVWKEFKKQSISLKSFKNNTHLFLQTIIEDVIDEWIFKGFALEEQEKLKSILQPLSIARLFNLISLQKLIEEFADKKYHLLSSFYYSNYIRELQSKTNFIRYEKAKSGYILDPTLASAFSSAMKCNNPELYKTIHQRLIEIYSAWIDDSKGTDKIKYIIEKLYHRLKIDTPIEKTIAEFKEYLNAFKGKTNEHLRLQFREELERDLDLRDLLKNRIVELSNYIDNL